jgi:hypothetical protein
LVRREGNRVLGGLTSVRRAGAALACIALIVPARARAEVSPEARVSIEAGMGVVLGVVGLAGGAALACLFADDDGEWGCLAPAFVGAALGGVGGMGAGIYAGGRIAGTEGNYAATVGLEVVGAMVGATLTWLVEELLASDSDTLAMAVLIVIPLMLAGGIAGYEATI